MIYRVVRVIEVWKSIICGINFITRLSVVLTTFSMQNGYNSLIRFLCKFYLFVHKNISYCWYARSRYFTYILLYCHNLAISIQSLLSYRGSLLDGQAHFPVDVDMAVC